jgi:hypothetical protein
VEQFMVAKLGFATRAEAKKCRDHYFDKYHSTLKSLTIADLEGVLPRKFNQVVLTYDPGSNFLYDPSH